MRQVDKYQPLSIEQFPISRRTALALMALYGAFAAEAGEALSLRLTVLILAAIGRDSSPMSTRMAIWALRSTETESITIAESTVLS